MLEGVKFRSGSFNSRLREEATCLVRSAIDVRGGFNSRLREEATDYTHA